MDYYAFDPHTLEEKGYGLSVINHNIADKKCVFLVHDKEFVLFFVPYKYFPKIAVSSFSVVQSCHYIYIYIYIYIYMYVCVKKNYIYIYINTGPLA